jgi:hypothetical protein
MTLVFACSMPTEAPQAEAACVVYEDYIKLANSVDTPGQTFDMKIVGNIMYLADRFGGFRLYDVTDPLIPTELGDVFINDAHGVWIEGTIAYVTGEGLLTAVDVSDPTTPTILDTLDPASAKSYNVEVVGTYAYVADDFDGFNVVDITDPSNMVSVATLPPANEMLDIDIEGSYAYIADAFAGLSVIDISDPLAPVMLVSIPTAKAAFKLWANATNVYLAEYGGDVTIYDLTDPALPVEVASINVGPARDVMLQGDVAYVAAHTDGARTIDVSDPANPAMMGGVDTPEYSRTIWAAGDYVYTGDESSGIQVIDTSNPYSPSVMGRVNTSGSSSTVAALGDVVYIADSAGGVNVVDISDIDAPASLGAVATADANDIDVSGSLLVVADGETGGVVILDAAIPDVAAPVILGSVATTNALDVQVMGTLAYVADGAGGVVVIDVADPAVPVVMGSVLVIGDAVALDLFGTMAYVAINEAGYFQLVDVSDPAVPVARGFVDTPDVSTGVVATATRAYVMNRVSVQVVDVQDDDAPVIIGSALTPGSARGGRIVQGRLFVGDGSAGISILPLDCNEVVDISESAPVARLPVRVSPNPAPRTMTVSWTQDAAGPVRVLAFDAGGRRVARILETRLEAGARSARWDGMTDSGRTAPSGVYFVRVESAGLTRVARVVRP